MKKVNVIYKIIIILFLSLSPTFSAYGETNIKIKIPGNIEWGDDKSKLKGGEEREEYGLFTFDFDYRLHNPPFYKYIEIKKDIGVYKYRFDKDSRIYYITIEVRIILEPFKLDKSISRFFSILKKFRKKYGEPKNEVKRYVELYMEYQKNLYWEDEGTFLKVSYKYRSGEKTLLRYLHAHIL